VTTSILIVDDSEVMRETVADYCIDFDFDYDTVETAEAALEVLARKAYTLVFLDVHLPGMDGVEAARRIHALRPDQKVVFMTTDRGEELFDTTSARGFPVHGFINKPFTRATMSDCLRTVLDLGGAYRHRKEGYGV